MTFGIKRSCTALLAAICLAGSAIAAGAAGGTVAAKGRHPATSGHRRAHPSRRY
jgi:hypothetical protein